LDQSIRDAAADERLAEIRKTNELMTRTGPSTPMGDLLRRYWQPVALQSDLDAGDPVPLRIMSEDLVLFRDDQGRVGLLGIKCAHRCADLSYGRVEHGGLRCVYHGWLYDVNGRCLQQPGEPGGGVHKDQIRHKAYPCREAGGLIWAYMGPGEPPLLPNYPAFTESDAYRYSARWLIECNFLHANEGSIDPVHTSYLHAYNYKTNETQRRSMEVFQADLAPRLRVAESRYGLRIFAERNASTPGKKTLRVTNFLMPNGAAINGPEAGLGRGGLSIHYHVPIDDTHHWRFEMRFHSKKAIDKVALAQQHRDEKIAGDRPRRTAENRYLQNRDEMKRGISFIGMGPMFPVHDVFVTQSQGAIHDQSAEHLTTTDVAIVRARRQLLGALKDVTAGRDPVGVMRDEAQNECSDLLVLTETLDAAEDVDAFCERMTAEKIYTLDPALAASK